MDIQQKIKQQAYDFGFDAVGFAPVTIPKKNKVRLVEFLEEKSYGTMEWMATRQHHRESPQGLWPEVKSVITLGINYGPAHDPLLKNLYPDRANISVYAQNKDYHDLIKKRLKRLARWIVETYKNDTYNPETDVKVFVDTAPVLEKAIAAQSQLGWQGKHTNIVSREFGNWLFLGEIYTTLEIPSETPEKDHCGSCQSCHDICPTNAFPTPYQLDAKRCISYLTIEHQGMIDEEFRKPMGNRIYGCDDCLAVCPWNKFSKTTTDSNYWPRAELQAPRLIDFLTLSDAEFRQFFQGSPIKRIGRERFLRNILIALGNSGLQKAIKEIIPLLKDPSPIIRASAVWAIYCLAPKNDFQEIKKQYTSEQEEIVLEEWDR